MYIRLVLTLSKDEQLIPKEAHIDTPNCSHDYHVKVLTDCLDVLNEKLPEIKKMIPKHLKGREFDMVIHGEYLKGLDYIPGNETCTVEQRWKYAVPIFNVKQLGIPEGNRPLLHSV